MLSTEKQPQASLILWFKWVAHVDSSQMCVTSEAKSLYRQPLSTTWLVRLVWRFGNERAAKSRFSCTTVLPNLSKSIHDRIESELDSCFDAP